MLPHSCTAPTLWLKESSLLHLLVIVPMSLHCLQQLSPGFLSIVSWLDPLSYLEPPNHETS